MKPRHKKMIFIVGGLAVIGVVTALVVNAFRNNLVFFFTPSQIAAHEAPLGRSFRVGGLVTTGSLERGKDGLSVRFVVTDMAQSVPVVYSGILPDLFKEGKGVVAQGHMEANGVFRADEVLAKHDENYMPPEAAHALEQARSQSTPTMNKEAPAKMARKKIELTADALFDTNKSVLKSEGMEKLDSLSQSLDGVNFKVIMVTGHPDYRSSTRFNQKLSERRANAVKSYLESKGIANPIVASGKGESEPKTTPSECKGMKGKALSECLQPDRRVEVSVEGEQ